MKKLISIITILTLILCMSATVSMAANDRGGDAHSPSMSAESGEEPIADQATTEEGGGAAVDEEPEQIIPDEPQEDAELAPEDEEADPGFTFNSRPIIFIAIGAVVLIAIVVAIAKKSSRKKKNDYRAKH